MKTKRILTITLVGLGAAILILGAVLFLTLPAETWTAGPAGMWQGHHGAWLANPQAAAPDQTAPGAGVFGPGMGRFAGHMGHGGMGGFGGGLLGLVLLAGLVFLVVGFARRRHGRNGHGSEGCVHESAEEILRRSFAEGKLNADEYRSRMDVLRGKGE